MPGSGHEITVNENHSRFVEQDILHPEAQKDFKPYAFTHYNTRETLCTPVQRFEGRVSSVGIVFPDVIVDYKKGIPAKVRVFNRKACVKEVGNFYDLDLADLEYKKYKPHYAEFTPAVTFDLPGKHAWKAMKNCEKTSDILQKINEIRRYAFYINKHKEYSADAIFGNIRDMFTPANSVRKNAVVERERDSGHIITYR